MTDRTVNLQIRASDLSEQAFRSYNQHLARMERNTQEASRSTGGLRSRLDGLNGVLQGMAAAGTIMGAFQGLSALNDVGRQVTAVQNSFTALSGSEAEAARNMEMLRAATHGTVDDLTLMQSSTAMLMQGLAQTGEEAAELTGIATTLGNAVGLSTTDALAQFGQMLRNQSIPMLDNFGLSSGRVRARIEELRAEFPEMSREIAFSQAVMEQADDAINRLGDSVTQNITAFDQVRAGIQNAFQDVGQFISSGIEAGAQLVLIGAALTEDLIEGIETQMQGERVRVEEIGRQIATDLRRGFEDAGAAEDVGEEYIQFVAESAAVDPQFIQREIATLYEQAAQLQQNLLNAPTEEMAAGFRDQIEALYAQIDALQNSAQSTYEVVISAEERRANAIELSRLQAEAFERQSEEAAAAAVERARVELQTAERIRIGQQAGAREFEVYGNMYTRAAEQQAELVRNIEFQNAALERSQAFLGEISATWGTIGQEQREAAQTAGDVFSGFRDALLPVQDAVINTARHVVSLVEEAASLNRATGTVDDLAGAFENVNDAAQDVAASMNEILGISTGGFQAQVVDFLFPAGGLDDEFNNWLELQTGEASPMSQNLENVYGPQFQEVWTTMGEEAASAYLDAVTGALETAGAEGREATDEDIQNALMEAGFVGGGEGMEQAITIDVQPGDTVIGLANQLGMSPEEFMEAIMLGDPRLLQVGQYEIGGGGGGGLIWNPNFGVSGPEEQGDAGFGGGTGMEMFTEQADNIATRFESAAQNVALVDTHITNAADYAVKFADEVTRADSTAITLTANADQVRAQMGKVVDATTEFDSALGDAETRLNGLERAYQIEFMVIANAPESQAALRPLLEEILADVISQNNGREPGGGRDK